MIRLSRPASSNSSLPNFADRSGFKGRIRCHASTKDPHPKPIVVVGSVNADLVVKIDRLPKAGETIAGSSLEFFPGGKGANQAAAAAKLGYPTYFIGQVGTDSNAAALRAALEQYGVRPEQLRVVPGASGTALILLQPSGENSIVIVGGANQDGWELTNEAMELVANAGAVLLQREIPEDINIRVAAAATAAGVPVMLDAGGIAAPIAPQLLQHVTWCSPNETELARLTGLPTGTKGEVQAAAQALMKQGVHQVLVKLGAEGSMLVQSVSRDAAGAGAAASATAPIVQQAVVVEKVVDTTGAGDCFTAAFVVGVLQGREPRDALKFASAAASICVQRRGAMPSMPDSKDVQLVLQEWRGT